MNFKEWIEKLKIEGVDVSKLVDEVNKIAEKDNVKILVGKQGEYIPKVRLDDEIEKKKLVEKQLDNANNTVKSLEKNLKGKEEELKDIADLKSKNDELENKITTMTRDRAIKDQLSKGKYAPRENDVVMKFLDLDSIKIKDNGEIEGLDNQIENLYKEKDYLFNEVEGGTGNIHNPKRNKDKGNDLGIGEQLAKDNKESNDNLTEARDNYFK